MKSESTEQSMNSNRMETMRSKSSWRLKWRKGSVNWSW